MLVVMGTDCTGSCKSNYYKITTMMPPVGVRNRFNGVMVSVLISTAVDRELEPWSDQTKYSKISICCSSGKL